MLMKKINIFIFFLVMFFSFSASVFAYNDYDNIGCKWSNPGSVKYNIISSTPHSYKTLFSSGITKWNSTPTNISLSFGGYTNTLGVFEKDSTTMERVIVHCSI